MAVAPLLIGFLVTMTMMFALRPFAVQIGLVDVPGGRKTHNGAVPVIGGLGMFVGLLAGTLSVGLGSTPPNAVLVAAAIMVIVGAFDDRFELPPYARILAHLAAVLTLVLASGMTVGSLGNLFGFHDIELGAADFIFTVVAAIALINAFNMLDGLDGLAGGVALVALLGLAVYFSGAAVAGALVATLALAGAIVAFLVFNVPARFNRPVLAFMGDAGSTLVGFTIAGLALSAVQPAPERLAPVVVLWLLPVPVLELFSSTFRRIATGLSPMQADRGHFHHRLLEAGFSVRAIFLLYFFSSAASAAVGIAAWRAGASEALLFWSYLGVVAVWGLATYHASRWVRWLPKSLKRGEVAPLRRARERLVRRHRAAASGD